MCALGVGGPREGAGASGTGHGQTGAVGASAGPRRNGVAAFHPDLEPVTAAPHPHNGRVLARGPQPPRGPCALTHAPAVGDGEPVGGGIVPRRFQIQLQVQRHCGLGVLGDLLGRGLGRVGLDEVGAQVAGHHPRMVQQPPQVGGVGHTPQQQVGAQGAVHPVQCLGAAGAPRDDLGEHGVEVGGDDGALRDPGVHARPLAAGFGQRQHRAAAGQEPVVGVLGVDPALHRVPVHRHLVLTEGQRLAPGHPHLELDQVDAAHAVHGHDLLGDGVLDLQTGVHLHEVEGHPAARLGVGDELDGAGAHVSAGLGGGHGRLPHPGALVLGQQG